MTPSWKSLLQPAQLWKILKDTFTEWSKDKVPRHGAALAYYTVLSLVPLLVVIIAIIGLIFGREVGQGFILEQIAGLVGPQSAEAIKEMIQRASEPSTGIVATILAGGTLLLGASAVFAQLQDSLNSIWGVEPKEGRGLWGLIHDRFLSVAALLGTGFLLLVSLVLSGALAAFGNWFGGWLPAPEIVLHLLEFLISLAVITGLFAMIFKVLPDAHVAWSDVWIGAALTSLLFTIGKFAIGLYLGKTDVGSAYGAAGSLVIVLIWVYYSAQILLFGAEFTQVYANKVGAGIAPSGHAMVADSKKSNKPEAFGPLPGGKVIDKQTDNRGWAASGADLTSRRSAALNAPFPWWVGVMLIGLSLIRSSRRPAK
ncbi:MAG: YihY/virulence factor BrkB family protein [Nitrospira sp.]